MPRTLPPVSDEEALERPQFALSEAEWAEAASFLRLAAKEGASVRAQAEDIGADFLRTRDQETMVPTRRGRNAMLKKLAELCGKFYAAPAVENTPKLKRELWFAFDGLDGGAALEIRHRLSWEYPFPATDEEFFTVVDYQAVAAAALAFRDITPGKQIDQTLMSAAYQLLQLFEETTGENATHSTTKNSVHVDAPQSKAGRFVETIIRAADRSGAAAAAAQDKAATTDKAALVAHQKRKPISAAKMARAIKKAVAILHKEHVVP